MKPEFKTPWLEALRSGEYQQTRETLCREEEEPDSPPVGYCCLGVLCDVLRKQGVGEWRETCFVFVTERDDPEEYPEHWLDSELDGAALQIVGLTEDAQKDLIMLNDDECEPFENIADWIEKNL